MATKDQNTKQIEELSLDIKSREDERTQLNSKIEKLERIIKEKNGEVVDLMNKIDQLETQGGPLSQTTVQKLRSELARYKTENEHKSSKIS